ncbi:YaaA family protein [Pedococcus sp. 5OH_020]|uniref:YaaA family protein n=1 Tax=Pedococcus sp. 5OH_020 TaxID=2989814 RepID=UPI0022E99C6B|nr:peroxide stress protein YaaA [Pedococcus sp. 5OH_020]
MLILLPPSESKTERRRGRPVDPLALSFPSLSQTRRDVAEAVAKVSAHPDAATTLGVSHNLTAEIARNLALGSAPAAPASRVYSGVLYDALDYASLGPGAKRRANRWLVVVSALYGAVRPTDLIAPYRLSMAVNLPGVGPLASAWKPELERVLPDVAGRGVVVDCRSSTYAAAWVPRGPLAERWVQVRVPGATHQAKHTRGLVARRLCELGRDARRVPDLPTFLRDAFTVELHEPARPGGPWVLDAAAR